MAKLDFRHEISTPDNESSFEAFRNEDPFSFSFDVRITTARETPEHETLEMIHVTHNQMLTKYRKWMAEHNCKVNAYEQDFSE